MERIGFELISMAHTDFTTIWKFSFFPPKLQHIRSAHKRVIKPCLYKNRAKWHRQNQQSHSWCDFNRTFATKNAHLRLCAIAAFDFPKLSHIDEKFRSLSKFLDCLVYEFLNCLVLSLSRVIFVRVSELDITYFRVQLNDHLLIQNLFLHYVQVEMCSRNFFSFSNSTIINEPINVFR